MGKFEINLDKAGKFRFNLKAGNGQVILSSDPYSSKKGCEDGIISVRKNSLEDERFIRCMAKDGSPYFKLMATNGRLLGMSEMYSSISAMENGIASVRTNAPGALINDLTQS